MEEKPTTVPLEDGIDLRELMTTGSVIHINEVYDEAEPYTDPDQPRAKHIDFIGQPVKDFKELEKTLKSIDEDGYVKKKIIEEGGGIPLHDGNTVSVAFSGYWENECEAFDARSLHKPLVVDLKENGLLPGLQIAIKSMLVGEVSIFLFTHHLMYGEMGIPPRIKAKTSSVFYIKLVKSIITPKEAPIDFSEPNMFRRVDREVRLLLSSGWSLYKINNYSAAISVFRKAVNLLHKCRLADENEEKLQEKLLVKSYINLALCYNQTKQPLKACSACNELRRLNKLWNNPKVLFINAKALRMIGQFDCAEKRLKKALQLASDKNKHNVLDELQLLKKSQEMCNRAKVIERAALTKKDISDEFKKEVDNLIKNFKENSDLHKLMMPHGLNISEVEYIKETCIKENVFCRKVKNEFPLENDDQQPSSSEGKINERYALDKFEDVNETDQNEE
ncbi:inactive peptidyl-prolyl cis-trans isomerase shutdown-like [Ostrinia furnacalis]|uniref:inactive peptidyl-prolyl cis-trans isomerase shutdown-like n=1 Tax=Ostrinia furnacalis TaxID=93504 RepID=UPI0010395A55|nr:inactive peptidyl-prolyl cis-trans isomerase shutdown-like [Ostrinia furnacalis]